MIHASNMKETTIVKDTDSKRFFALEEPVSDDGPWPARDCRTNGKTTFRFGDLARLEVAPSVIDLDVNFDAVIGRRVRLRLTYGATITGKVDAIVRHSLIVDGVVHELPIALKIAGENYELSKISEVTKP